MWGSPLLIDTRNLPGDLEVSISHISSIDENGIPDQQIEYKFTDSNDVILTGLWNTSDDYPSLHLNHNRDFFISTCRAKDGFLASDAAVTNVIHCLIGLGFTAFSYTESGKYLTLQLNPNDPNFDKLARYDVTHASLNTWINQASEPLSKKSEGELEHAH